MSSPCFYSLGITCLDATHPFIHPFSKHSDWCFCEHWVAGVYPNYCQPRRGLHWTVLQSIIEPLRDKQTHIHSNKGTIYRLTYEFCFWIVGEARVPREMPHMHEENMQTLGRVFCTVWYWVGFFSLEISFKSSKHLQIRLIHLPHILVVFS